jgi:hypothetical protein
LSEFSSEWLALREPYDLEARNPAVLAAVVDAFADRAAIAIVDLACGTGATFRAIASHLPQQQDWRLVDRDARLLAEASAVGSNVAPVRLDIARDLHGTLAASIDLVTTSALLDLVSADWLAALTKEVAGRGLYLYAALNYDGDIIFDPVDPFDASIVEAVNRHQRGDKGFGSALGPAAVRTATANLKALGCQLFAGKSDWMLRPMDREIQSELLAGWASAAIEVDGLSAAGIKAWLTRRRDHVSAWRSSIRVGHSDFFACPTSAR